jgi:hypothetical protein
VSPKITLNEHLGLTVGDVLAIDWVEITFGVAQIMHRVQHVGLSTSVISEQAIHLIPESQIRPDVIFEVMQVKMFENHDANFIIFARS